MSGSAENTQAELLVEINGPNVSPDSVDAGAALVVAAAYIRLVLQVAKDEGNELSFTSLHVRDKCVEFALRPTDSDAARQSAKRSIRYIQGAEHAPRGFVELLKDVRNALKMLPEGYSASVSSGVWSEGIGFSDSVAACAPYETISLRVKAVRVGGKQPAAKFESDSEERSFSLQITESQAPEIGSHLYRWMDIVARVTRSSDGRIETGQLLEFEPLLDTTGATNAWHEWYRANGAAWDDVGDIEAELDRDPDR